jgi:hypothetical protein
MGNIKLCKTTKIEQNQLINEKVICMCPKMFDPRISETNSESPKFFLPIDSGQQHSSSDKLKKIKFADFEKFKGGFSNF